MICVQGCESAPPVLAKLEGKAASAGFRAFFNPPVLPIIVVIVEQVIERRRAFPTMPANVIHGGCLCGAVRYEAGGRPYHITHCHCADCRRSSGAAFVTWASFRRADFRFTQGEPREIAWAGRARSFCARCGTPLMFMTSPEADEVDVTVCSFDQPESVSPADHTWIEDRLPWIPPPGGLPTYEQKRPEHESQR